jgi:hypothetical protein
MPVNENAVVTMTGGNIDRVYLTEGGSVNVTLRVERLHAFKPKRWPR